MKKKLYETLNPKRSEFRDIILRSEKSVSKADFKNWKEECQVKKVKSKNVKSKNVKSKKSVSRGEK